MRGNKWQFLSTPLQLLLQSQSAVWASEHADERGSRRRGAKQEMGHSERGGRRKQRLYSSHVLQSSIVKICNWASEFILLKSTLFTATVKCRCDEF